MASDFQLCCPNCGLADFQPVELKQVGFGPKDQVRIERRANSPCEHSYIAKRFPYNGEELHHCNYCGLVFEQPVELRLLEPTPEPGYGMWLDSIS